ncbi:hypothetical protein [Caulobacter sp. S45]|uniref:hypothetical protein n=1 Tax=Caulobacter sp. S45 TaxID=1641861 RepID=UPI00131E5DFD|nr:hypothetical protein [Caulobacter sp. S45]
MAGDGAKAERLAQALRANLRRRKAAASPPSSEQEATRDPSPREPPDKPQT